MALASLDAQNATATPEMTEEDDKDQEGTPPSAAAGFGADESASDSIASYLAPTVSSEHRRLLPRFVEPDITDVKKPTTRSLIALKNPVRENDMVMERVIRLLKISKSMRAANPTFAIENSVATEIS